MLQKTIRELLINALKFSNKESDIHVLVDACDQNVSLCILNEVAKNDMNIVGIPKEYEKMVFKPFVRLTKIAFDEYGSLDTGLGLPFVEQVILRHNGNIQISNMNDYTAPGHNRRIVVNVSIQIPKTGFSTIS